MMKMMMGMMMMEDCYWGDFGGKLKEDLLQLVCGLMNGTYIDQMELREKLLLAWRVPSPSMP